MVSGEGTGNFDNFIGELRGSGKISSNYFSNAAGTLIPGFNSPGLMNFDTDEDFSDCSINMEVLGTKTAGIDFDQILVNGSAKLGGSLKVGCRIR